MDERAIFFEALEQEDSTGRAAYLDGACAGDPDLRLRIEALLQSHSTAGDFLDRPAAQQLSAEDAGHRDRGRSAANESNLEGAEVNVPLDFLEKSLRPDSLGRLGHYEVLSLVGRGGMGIVLRAFDEKLQRVVAIKVLAPAAAASGVARRRFVREAQAAAAVVHDNVVAIHGVEHQGAVPFLVMQFIDGLTLQEKLDRVGPLPVTEVLRIGIQTASGLAAAHARGLVHRDVKPANILLENGSERVKITDFGLARAVDDVGMTQSGLIAGTPAYMSPEQANDDPVDHRSDLFSLGSVLYAACTGDAPFRAGSTVATLRRVCDTTPRPIRQVNADVPQWLASTIAKLHAKSAAKRYQTAAEVAELLGFHLASPRQPGSKGRRSVVESRWGLQKRGALAAAFLGTVGIAGLGVGAAAYHASRRERGATPPANTPDAHKQDVVPVAKGDPTRVLAVSSEDSPFRFPKPGQSHWMGLSRDGRLLAVPCDGDVILFDAGSGRLIRVLSGSDFRTYRPDFSPDGARLAAGCEDCRVRVWDVATGRVLLTLTGHARPVYTVAFDRQGKRLVSADANGEIRVWDAQGGALHRFQAHDGLVNHIAFSPGGERLATASSDRYCKIWDSTADWKPVRGLTGKNLEFQAVAWSNDAKFLAAGDDYTVTIWNADNYAALHWKELPSKGLLQFSPDGRTLSTARHYDPQRLAFSIFRTDVATGVVQTNLALKMRGGYGFFLLSKDGRTAFASRAIPSKDEVFVYDAETGRERFQPHDPRP